jgi:hypothetical protein
VDQLEAAIPLTIKVAAWPNDKNERIPCKPMMAKDKLAAEGGSSETKMILRWHFNVRTLTISIPEHEFIAWSAESQQMISMSETSKKVLESTIRQIRHANFVIPCIYHYLSRLQTLLARSRNRRFIAINDKYKMDLELMQSIMEKAKEGIDMIVLPFRSPDKIYYSN